MHGCSDTRVGGLALLCLSNLESRLWLETVDPGIAYDLWVVNTLEGSRTF